MNVSGPGDHRIEGIQPSILSSKVEKLAHQAGLGEIAEKLGNPASITPADTAKLQALLKNAPTLGLYIGNIPSSPELEQLKENYESAVKDYEADLAQYGKSIPSSLEKVERAKEEYGKKMLEAINDAPDMRPEQKAALFAMATICQPITRRNF